ncbi:MAG: S-methyl-5'-thioadenosine phosphorylase [Planctomycetota bacterium]|jgi:5'-methylthioadenosine phosphorylase
MAKGLIGLIGGTGLADALAESLSDVKLHNVDTPFGKPSAEIAVGKIGKRQVAFLSRHGRGHKYSPSRVPFAANIFALKSLGVHTLITSGAVGSLRQEVKPGDIVVVDQFIDKTSRRKSSFFEDFGAVHCEMSQPVCRRLADRVLAVGETLDMTVHPKGTYVCMEGPQFSTKAESLMHRAWGGDLIGMTAMPEAKLAREAQMCYATVALVSDYDCWREHQADLDKQTLLAEIISNLQTATDNCIKLIKAVLDSDKELVFEDCSCRKSLELAVWTSRDTIEASAKDKLSVLFE